VCGSLRRAVGLPGSINPGENRSLVLSSRHYVTNLSPVHQLRTAASGGGVGRGSFPRPDFRSSSSHRASGIVHHEGDQMPSRQLFGSSRLDRDHLTGSGRRAAPLVTRRSLRNARGELSAETLTGQSGGTFQGLFTRDAAGSSAPGTKLPPSSVAPHRQRPFSSSTGCPDAN